MIMLLATLLSLCASARAGCIISNTKCYVDSATRVLGTANVAPNEPITAEYCAQLCANLKMTISGTEVSEHVQSHKHLALTKRHSVCPQNGNECYCGTALNTASPGEDKTGCKTTCSGSSSETCGGYWRLQVAPVNCSGAPEPRPKTPPLLVNPCLDKSGKFASQPWCDATLPIDARVADAISRLTLQEKINLMGTGGAPIESLGLPSYNWWSEASSGVASGRDTQTTKFAFPITTGMSFNRTLWAVTGRQIATEARAMMNAGNGYSTFWAPVINLAREPRWGRNIETPGEDPYLSGEYATHFVRGFQEAPQDEGHLLASACCKHYVANSMDGTTQADGEHHDRNHVDSQITMRDLVDSCEPATLSRSPRTVRAPRSHARPHAHPQARASPTHRPRTVHVPSNARPQGSRRGLMCRGALCPRQTCCPSRHASKRGKSPLSCALTTRSTACLRAPTTGCWTRSRARTGASTVTSRPTATRTMTSTSLTTTRLRPRRLLRTCCARARMSIAAVSSPSTPSRRLTRALSRRPISTRASPISSRWGAPSPPL